VRHLGTCSLLVLLAASPALCCLCATDHEPTCERLRVYKGAALFLGVVTDVRYRRVSVGNVPVREQVIKFNIEEAFAGVEGKDVTLTSFADASMCGYRFRKGSRYLVDADNGGSWSVSQLSVSSCGMTATAADSVEEIRFLRTVKRNPHAGILFGTVKEYVEGSTFVSPNNKPITGASVMLTAEPNALLHAEEREAHVDSTGWYEFVDLPEGIYTATVQVPEGFSGVLQHTVGLRKDGCAQVDVRVNGPEKH